jgi:homoaconitate hydratase
LRSAFLTTADAKSKVSSRRTGWEAVVDYVGGKVTVKINGEEEKVYKIPVVGKAAQELVVEGGLESWVKRRI